MKQILLRLDDAMADELRQAAYDERLSQTEILIQGLVIRLRMPGKSRLPVLLGKLRYQPRQRPGRPSRVPCDANGNAPPIDDWDLADMPAGHTPGGTVSWNMDDLS
jgi:hypothetical protein